MERIKKQFNMLKVLSTFKKNMRKNIIDKADKELINTICECVLNLLNGNLKVNTEQFNNLRAYKKVFRKLLEKINLKEKKKLIIQKGGFKEILLPAVISGLASIIGSAISSA